ncbi:hypothetical protein D3C87_63440 [compost metagenome]
MKGPVKSVCESTTKFDSITERILFLRKEYLFSESKNLLHYTKDTTSTLFETDGTKEIVFTYDSAGRLLESVTFSVQPMNPSKTMKKWNSQGFIVQEIYSCDRCGSGSYSSYRDAGIVDYTLDYQWSTDFDSVSLKYQYLKPKSASPYQRESDRTYSFVRELNEKKAKNSKSDTKYAADFDQNYFLFQVNDIKRDEQDRITEWIIWDHAIKSSINVHRKSEYTYNERGELTEIQYSSTRHSNSHDEFRLDLKIELVYTSYDAYGNWIEREIRFNPEHYGRRSACEIYHHKREFVYY